MFLLLFTQYLLANILCLLQVAFPKMVHSHVEKRCDIFIY